MDDAYSTDHDKEMCTDTEHTNRTRSEYDRGERRSIGVAPAMMCSYCNFRRDLSPTHAGVGWVQAKE